VLFPFLSLYFVILQKLKFNNLSFSLPFFFLHLVEKAMQPLLKKNIGKLFGLTLPFPLLCENF
jgi:hypothetical protein